MKNTVLTGGAICNFNGVGELWWEKFSLVGTIKSRKIQFLSVQLSRGLDVKNNTGGAIKSRKISLVGELWSEKFSLVVEIKSRKFYSVVKSGRGNSVWSVQLSRGLDVM